MIRFKMTVIILLCIILEHCVCITNDWIRFHNSNEDENELMNNFTLEDEKEYEYDFQ